MKRIARIERQIEKYSSPTATDWRATEISIIQNEARNKSRIQLTVYDMISGGTKADVFIINSHNTSFIVEFLKRKFPPLPGIPTTLIFIPDNNRDPGTWEDPAE